MSDVHNKNKTKCAYYCSIGFMILLSVTFLIMPFASDLAAKKQTRFPVACIGIVLWLSLIVAYSLLAYIGYQRRHDKNMKKQRKRIGIFHFFSNRKAIIADICLVLSLIGSICCLLTTTEYIAYVFLSLFVLSIQMHGVLNGINFIYIHQIEDGESSHD